MAAVCDVVEVLLRGGSLLAAEVCILAAYTAQARAVKAALGARPGPAEGLPEVSTVEGCRGLVVMASGWQSIDRQFEPHLSAFVAALLRCGLGCRSRTDGIIHRS